MNIPDQAVVPPSKEKMRWPVLVLISILILFVLSMVTAAAYSFYPPLKNRVDEGVTALRVPNDLRTAVFLGTADGKPVSYKAKAFGFVPQDSTARSVGTFRSPNGTQYTYAQSFVHGQYMKGVIGDTPVDVEKWLVYIRMKDSEPTLIAKGYAPAFLDDTHIMYFAPGGIAIRDLSSGASSLLSTYASGTSTSISQVQYSPDRLHVMWTNASTSETVLASVGSASYRPLHIFTKLVHPVLTDTYIYDVVALPKGTELRRYDFEGNAPVLVFTIPGSLMIRLILL